MKYDAEYYNQIREKANNQILGIIKDYRENPEHIIEYLQFCSKMYRYSLNNTILIYSQNPNASYVQSFDQWRKLGYSVRRGEHGLDVFVPVHITYVKDNGQWRRLQDIKGTPLFKDYKEGRLEEKKQLSFKIGKTYDISQTTCPLERYPDFMMLGYKSDMHKEIIEGLVVFNRKYLDTDVNFKNLNSVTLKGYNAVGQHQIFINDFFGDNEQLSTLIHETGHQILHQESQGEKSLAQIEFEADAFSIICNNCFGLDVEESRKKHLVSHGKQMFLEHSDSDKEEYLKEVLNNVLEMSKKHMETMRQEINFVHEKHREKGKEKGETKGIEK